MFTRLGYPAQRAEHGPWSSGLIEFEVVGICQNQVSMFRACRKDRNMLLLNWSNESCGSLMLQDMGYRAFKSDAGRDRAKLELKFCG